MCLGSAAIAAAGEFFKEPIVNAIKGIMSDITDDLKGNVQMAVEFVNKGFKKLREAVQWFGAKVHAGNMFMCYKALTI